MERERNRKIKRDGSTGGLGVTAVGVGIGVCACLHASRHMWV